MAINPVCTEEFRQSPTYLQKTQERINKFIVTHSNINEEKLHEFMFHTGEFATTIGSFIDSTTAKKCGLIDKIGGLSDALSDSCFQDVA